MDLVLLAFAGILGRLAWTSFREARDGHARWTRGLAATPVTVAELVAMAGSVRDELDARAPAEPVDVPRRGLDHHVGLHVGQPAQLLLDHGGLPRPLGGQRHVRELAAAARFLSAMNALVADYRAELAADRPATPAS